MYFRFLKTLLCLPVFENSTLYSQGLKIPHTLLSLFPALRTTSEACSFTFLSTFQQLPPPTHTLPGQLLRLCGEQCIRIKNLPKNTGDVGIGY